MGSGLYTPSKQKIALGTVSWTADTIKVLLVRDSYTPSAAHEFASSLSGHEVSGGGYARITLASKTASDNTTDLRKEYDAADVSWTALGVAAGAFRYAIVIQDTGSDASSSLLAWHDLGVTTANGGDVSVAWAASGVFYREYFASAFTGADSTTNPGAGLTTVAGTAGISSNALYWSSMGGLPGGEPMVTHAAGTPDIDITGTVTTYTSAGAAIVFRVQNATNYLMAWLAPTPANAIHIYTRIAGSYALISFSADGTYTWTSGDVIRVHTFGDNIRVFRNGTEIRDITSSQFNTEDDHGLSPGSTATRWDDLRIDKAWGLAAPVFTFDIVVYPAAIDLALDVQTPTVGDQPRIVYPDVINVVVDLPLPSTAYPPAALTAANLLPADGTEGYRGDELFGIDWIASAGHEAADLTISVNGRALTVDESALGAGSLRARAAYPYPPGSELTVRSTAATVEDPARVYTQEWTVTTAPERPPARAALDGFVPRTAIAPAVLDGALPSTSPARAVLDGAVPGAGALYASPAVLDGASSPAFDPLRRTDALLEGAVTLEVIQIALQLGVVVGEHGQGVLQLGAEVRDEQATFVALQLGVELKARQPIGVLQLGAHVTEQRVATALQLGAVVGEHGQGVLQLGAEVEGPTATLGLQIHSPAVKFEVDE